MSEHDNVWSPDPPAEKEGVGAAIKALIEDGHTLLEAEMAYRKAQASYGLGEAKSIIALLLLGLAFGFFTLLAIVVGLLLALAHYIGVWGSLALVTAVLVLLTAASFARAAKKISAAKAGLTGGGDA